MIIKRRIENSVGQTYEYFYKGQWATFPELLAAPECTTKRSGTLSNRLCTMTHLTVEQAVTLKKKAGKKKKKRQSDFEYFLNVLNLFNGAINGNR